MIIPTIILRILPYLIIVGALLAALFGIYQYGRHVEGLERDSQQLAAVQSAVTESSRLAAIDLAAAIDAAKRDADRAITAAKRTTRTEQGIAAHPEYAACTLSADDLANLIDAVEGE